MRTLAVVTCIVLPFTIPLAAHAAEDGVRLVIRHEAPLLRSEDKALAVLEKELSRRRRGPVVRADATAAEVAATGTAPSPASLPAEWKAGVVVVLQVLPPAGEAPKRISGGLGSVLVFRPPALEPVYAERVTGTSDISLGDARFASWLAEMIASTGAAK